MEVDIQKYIVYILNFRIRIKKKYFWILTFEKHFYVDYIKIHINFWSFISETYLFVLQI